MNKQTQALKLALEALEAAPLEMVADENGHMVFLDEKAITAIREALAEQPAQQQEPVAVYVGETWCGSVVRLYEDLPLETPLYTSPPAQRTWIGVTDEEIEQVCVPLGAAMLSFTEVARAIEAKLREKNA